MVDSESILDRIYRINRICRFCRMNGILNVRFWIMDCGVAAVAGGGSGWGRF
jgi:hypothetical protein